MTCTDFKPEGAPTLIPYITVKDAQKAIDFYKNAFGFSLFCDPVRNDENHIIHVDMVYKDIMLMLAPEGAHERPHKAPATHDILSGMSLYIYCDDVDDFYKKAVNHGAKTLSKPEDCFWGDRMCRLMDPDGYEWGFATKIAKP